MQILFDSRDTQFKTPFGCLPLGETLHLNFCLKDAEETGVLFMLAEDGHEPVPHPMMHMGTKNGYHTYLLSIILSKTGLYFYHFKIETAQGAHHIFRDEQNRPKAEGHCWQLTCYKREHPISREFCGLVMYQIFPDRFNKKGSCDCSHKLTPFTLHEDVYEVPMFEPDENGEIRNNDFYGGNLAGIIEKLPYLKKLGVGALYLNPVFMAFSNHRYDTADYLCIDPLLGTNEDFKMLCDHAHALGMKVMIDGVFSHTGSDSRYFDIKNRFKGGAYHHPDSPYRSWFQFEDYPHRYTSWWGIATLPCTNENAPAFRRFILTDETSVIRYWLRQGADGWRLDVADELPDEFLLQLYKTVKEEKPNALVLGEVWEDASNKISYGNRRKYLQGACLDSVMNYVWRDAIIRFVRGEMSAGALQEAVMTICENYPADSLLATMNLLSTHDTPRILTVLGVDTWPQSRWERAAFRLSGAALERAKNRLYIAAFLLFCLPGNTCIYYGDEIGMEGFEDPFNRAYMGDRPIKPEISACYRALAEMKNKSSALRFGRLEPVFCGDGVFAFYRTLDEEQVLCVVNVSQTPRQLFAEGKLLFEKNLWQSGVRLSLLPYGCAAIKISCHTPESPCI